MSQPIQLRRKVGNLTLTKHACARMRENGLTYDDVAVLWNNATEELRGEGRSFYDFMHHKTPYLHNVKYYRSDHIRFVVDTREVIPKVITLMKIQDEDTKKN